MENNHISLIRDIQDRLYTETMRKVEKEIEIRLKDKLNKLGYIFDSQNHFLEFCRNRVTRALIQNTPNWTRYKFFLDYIDDKNKGTFLVGYEFNTDFDMENNQIKATVNYKIN